MALCVLFLGGTLFKGILFNPSRGAAVLSRRSANSARASWHPTYAGHQFRIRWDKPDAL